MLWTVVRLALLGLLVGAGAIALLRPDIPGRPTAAQEEMRSFLMTAEEFPLADFKISRDEPATFFEQPAWVRTYANEVKPRAVYTISVVFIPEESVLDAYNKLMSAQRGERLGTLPLGDEARLLEAVVDGTVVTGLVVRYGNALVWIISEIDDLDDRDARVRRTWQVGTRQLETMHRRSGG